MDLTLYRFAGATILAPNRLKSQNWISAECSALKANWKNSTCTHTLAQSERIGEHHLWQKNLHYCFVPPSEIEFHIRIHKHTTTTITTNVHPNQLLQTAGVLFDGQYIVLARSATANDNVGIYVLCSWIWTCVSLSFFFLFIWMFTIRPFVGSFVTCIY